MSLGRFMVASPALCVVLLAAPLHAEPPAKGTTDSLEVLEPEAEGDSEAPEFPPESTRWKLVLGGLGMTAVWYGAAAGASFAFPDAPGARDLRTPIVGPWQAIANNGCSADEPDCSGIIVALRTIVTAIDGLGQAAGPLLLLEGIFLRTGASEPSRSPRPTPGASPPQGPSSQPPPPATPPGPSDGTKNLFFLRPTTVGLRGVGLAVSGQF